ncbi:MAG: alpha/beta fold hydrolase [Pseudomonadota bacterium]
MDAITPMGERGRAGSGTGDDAAASQTPSVAELVDDFIMFALANGTGGVSPLAVATAWFDWTLHLSAAPGVSSKLAAQASAIAREFWLDCSPFYGSAPETARRSEPLFNKQRRALVKAFDAADHLVDSAASSVPGVSPHHRDLVRFAAHQVLGAWRPENFLFTNPDAVQRTVDEYGGNLLKGWTRLMRDMSEQISPTGRDTEDDGFAVGENLAVTPGSVVYRNDLIELIHYAPTGGGEYAEPILITPAWIMKYYIMDLSPENSLVRYLLEAGFSVFMISWRNPTSEDADLSFDDYRTRGVLSALDAVSSLRPGRPIHTVGYCLGGTLLSIAAAALTRDGDDRIASITLLAAQTDFRDPGPLGLFIDEAQLELLEASMASRGVLDADQMSGAFKLLRPRELVWRRLQQLYLLGEEEAQFDLLAWNADSTRMPRRMHTEYLRRLFLHNDFVQGRFEVDGRPAAISDIRAPIFALGTQKDHVAPWRSVYKINLFADTDVTFALVSGGHNAGIVNPPSRGRGAHQVMTKKDLDHFVGADDWASSAPRIDGSWWPTWIVWLTEHSNEKAPAQTPQRADVASNTLPTTSDLPAAPGAYVFT